MKWSWTMNFWWNRYDPLKFLWDPRLVFTGLTVLGYNRETGELLRQKHDMCVVSLPARKVLSAHLPTSMVCVDAWTVYFSGLCCVCMASCEECQH